MSIEHILGYTGWLCSDAMNNRKPTASPKAPTECKQIEHNIVFVERPEHRRGDDLVLNTLTVFSILITKSENTNSGGQR